MILAASSTYPLAIRPAKPQPQNQKSEYCAPLTSFDWNATDPSIIGTSSIDTTCTIWDLEAQQAKTQLIAHDKEVYDIAFAQGKNIFASVGADGSVRLFDLRYDDDSSVCGSGWLSPRLFFPFPLMRNLKFDTSFIITIFPIFPAPACHRSLEHSTIIYESESLHPLLRLAWNKQDPNYLATILTDSPRTVILDIRCPSLPVAELGAHTVRARWTPYMFVG